MLWGTTSNYTEHDGDKVRTTHISASCPDTELHKRLLPKYRPEEIAAAIRWLNVTELLGETGWGEVWVHTLTPAGIAVAQAGTFSDEQRAMFYQDDPYAVFVAHQFNDDDQAMVDYLNARVLRPAGFTMLDGRADGLEEFRHAIMSKMTRARFFVCLLTHRAALASGQAVSSVWLYQEVGAAIALGKKPLLLVEKGIDSDYVGEMQRVYEHLVFTRSNHPEIFERVADKLNVDLDVNNIPRPATAKTSA